MNTTILADDAAPRPARRFRKRWILWAFLLLWAGVGLWNVTRPMPPGTDVQSPTVAVAPGEIQFLYDETWADGTGTRNHEQRIFDAVLRIVDESESFLICDFFLFNDLMGAESAVHRQLSREFAQHLIARKAAKPQMPILLITDPINDIYGGMPSALLAELRAAGVEVVVTDLEKLRDSNPLYSSLWRIFGQWWGNSPQGGSLPNPFTNDPAATITLRSWLALLNFKANHRKLIVADRADGNLVALVTSANPHDGSSAHSNVAIRFTGELAQHLITSELGVARFSGWKGHIFAANAGPAAVDAQTAVNLSFVTEQAIRSHLVNALNGARNGDTVRLATFYLSDRRVVGALLDAAARGATVRLILDPNKDAFGRQKDGVPNRPVANELTTKSGGKIEVRWYRTHGEQFHTKIALIADSERLQASLGSANLTRRNIGNYNLEANITLDTRLDAPIAGEMIAWFDRLWNNAGAPGTEYTSAFGAYRDADQARYWRYRLMEATGLSTF